MFNPDGSNGAERERSLRQIVADAYTYLWDLFWLPIRLFAKLLLQSKLFPRRWTPWLFGALLGRWGEKINDDHYTLCSNTDCETCNSLLPGELDIDDDREITHDPFHILSSLRRKTHS
jgi:hypothetical protein